MNIIVVGGVAAGMSTAAKAKRTNPELNLSVFEKSHYISYGACGLPYVIGGTVESLDKLISRTPEQMAEQGVTVKVRHEVTEIDPDAKTVTVKKLDNGETFTESYDKLVLATGAVPVKPPLPGLDLAGVHTLRIVEDAAAIQKTIQEGAKEAVIIGGSYIGLELAEALTQAGLTVRIVEQQDVLLGNFGPVPSKLAFEEVQKKRRQRAFRREGHGVGG